MIRSLGVGGVTYAIYNKRRNYETVEKNDIQYNEIIKSQVMQLMNSSQLKTISIPNETVHRMI